MCYFINIFTLIFGLLFIPSEPQNTNTIQYKQIDSLIREKHIHNSMTQLELLILYQDALHFKPKDSIEIFKKLAILNAYLEQPKDALQYSEKYIKNTLDFSILSDPVYNNIKENEAYITLIEKYKSKISFISFLFFCMSLLGFLLAISILFSRNHTDQNTWYLSGLVFISALLILEYVIFTTRLIYKFPYLSIVASFFTLVYGPLLYAYFRSRSNNFKYNHSLLLHLLPAVFFILYIISFSLIDSLKLNRALLNFDRLFYFQIQVIVICKVCSLLIYTFLIVNNLEDKVFKPNSKKPKLTNGRADMGIFLIFTTYLICYGIYIINGSNYFIKSPNFFNYLYPITLSIMVVYISYLFLKKPYSFQNENQLIKDNFLSSKYQNSGLTQSLSKELKQSLLNLFLDNKIYKESNITLEYLATKLNTSRHNASQIINEHFNMSFFELINNYRIQEAKNIFESNTSFNLKIIDVAYEVGYNNKVTFNKAFKKETLLTPSQYVTMLKRQRGEG